MSAARGPVVSLLLAPRFWQWFHGAGGLLWLALSWPGLTSWRDAVWFVIAASLWSNIMLHVVGWVAAIGGRKADTHDQL